LTTRHNQLQPNILTFLLPRLTWAFVSLVWTNISLPTSIVVPDSMIHTPKQDTHLLQGPIWRARKKETGSTWTWWHTASNSDPILLIADHKTGGKWEHIFVCNILSVVEVSTSFPIAEVLTLT
jgi:hypothetical protein